MNMLNQICCNSILYVMTALPVSVCLAAGNEINLTNGSMSCAKGLPTDAISTGNFSLCELNENSENDLYACQTFNSSKGKFRVYFQGGRFPKAISRVAVNGKNIAIQRIQLNQQPQYVCNLAPPIQVPTTAIFVGAGICDNSVNQKVPCSVFRNKAPRLKNISDYLVFYDQLNKNSERVSLIPVQHNDDAVPAEMAYQIGLNLINTSCCRQKGMKYIELAMNLFPESEIYRATYQQLKHQTAGDTYRELISFEFEEVKYDSFNKEGAHEK